MHGNLIIDKDKGMAAGKPQGLHIWYNERNQPVQMGDDITYRYNAAGQRYYKQVAGGEEYYVMDGDLTMGVFTNSGSGWQLHHWNIVANGVEGRINENGSKNYYYKDHLGSTRAVVDAAGTVLQATDYYPFGLIMDGRSYLSGSPAKEGFTGKERDDETGFDYFGARLYRPDAPGFISVDPLASMYPQISPYVYVLNNPLSFVDPTGEYVVFAGRVGKRGNVFQLSRWRVSTVRRIEMFNSIAGWFPGGSMMRSAIRGTRDPSYSNTSFGIATDFVSFASPLAKKGTILASGLNISTRGVHTVDATNSLSNEFTPRAVGFDEVLFNTLTSFEYGDGKLFVDNGKTIGGAQISLRSDIANSGSLEDVSKLANSFIDATSTLLKAIANGQDVNFSSKEGRQKVMDEFEKNRDIYEYFIRITSARNLENE